MSDHQSKHRPNSAPEQAKKGERIKTVKHRRWREWRAAILRVQYRHSNS